ncbi:MAG: formate dehydrogenase accessory protein FdhE [Burkholderiaceae bacterium]
MSDPLIQPEVIPLHPAAPEPILLPDPATLFADRARRFDHFASHMPEQHLFFAFMAELARVQHAAAASFKPSGLPDANALATRHAHRMPVLPAGLADRDGSWVAALRAVLDANMAADAELPAAAAAARRSLRSSDGDGLDRLGSAVLAYEYESIPAATLPWVAAGLQVWWVTALHALARFDPSAVRALDIANVCPCCGSLPVASLRRIGGMQQGLRYLVCSLCATQWHMVRVKCSHCESTAGIGYLTLSKDPDSAAGKAAATREVVKAEVCDECSSYLKLVSLESDSQADPVADDLATLALDLLTDERGYARIGPNLFIHPGAVAA